MEQRDSAEGPERDRLGAQIIELEGRLRNIEPAFEAAQTRIRELEQLLEREGNQLGHEKVERAEKALAAGDFDEADELLAEISAEEDLAVQRKARAEFCRGQIAEEQVRWHDAAEHYDNAARLNRTFEHLRKAREFQWRSGNYQRADALGSMLIDAAMSEFGESSEQHAAALNIHALTLKDMGRYGEAEPLCQQAIEIGKATIGKAHPDYAIRLNNLANLLSDMGKYEDARETFAEMLPVFMASLGPEHPTTKIDANNYAILLRRHFPDDPALDQLKATFGDDIGLE